MFNVNGWINKLLFIHSFSQNMKSYPSYVFLTVLLNISKNSL